MRCGGLQRPVCRAAVRRLGYPGLDPGATQQFVTPRETLGYAALTQPTKRAYACFAAHSANTACIASKPSNNAAGPGCRMIGDLISCISPLRTAGTASQPGRCATRSGRKRLPHHEPRMMSGARCTTSPPSARMRCLASDSRACSGNTSSPPAMPINSATQRMPVNCPYRKCTPRHPTAIRDPHKLKRKSSQQPLPASVPDGHAT